MNEDAGKESPCEPAEAQWFTLRRQCNFPAPLVINGGAYAGCQLDAEHEQSEHEFKVVWG